MKLLVFHALRTQGSSWKKLLQQNFSKEGMSKSIEEQETKIHSEGSNRKAKKEKGNKLGGEQATVTPRSSHNIEELEKDNSVVKDPTK
jgi:hypothetical protein